MVGDKMVVGKISVDKMLVDKMLADKITSRQDAQAAVINVSPHSLANN